MNYVIVAMKAIFSNDFQLDSEFVTYVKDGWEAVREVERSLQDAKKDDYRPYSLLILDYNMPYMDGLTVVEQVSLICLKEGKLYPPFFLMQTSNQETAFREKCIRNRVDFFVEKPCKVENLAKVLLQLEIIREKKRYAQGLTIPSNNS